jgi:hypothetical protein
MWSCVLRCSLIPLTDVLITVIAVSCTNQVIRYQTPDRDWCSRPLNIHSLHTTATSRPLSYWLRLSFTPGINHSVLVYSRLNITHINFRNNLLVSYFMYRHLFTHSFPLHSSTMWNSLLKMVVLWVVAPCSPVEFYRRFRGARCLHHQDSGLRWLKN